MTTVAIDFIEITEVEYLSGYKIKILFNNEKQRIIDFEPFLRRSQHPEIRKYLDLKRFKQFTFEYGHLHWNDYDLSFSNDDLYDKQIG
ncbi:MAG: DUF2442 domain-containing protein [SAR324 cluster bacterium]|nr:DUF2442 domain-containing protein [SAR324 cluster bacterium]